MKIGLKPAVKCVLLLFPLALNAVILNAQSEPESAEAKIPTGADVRGNSTDSEEKSATAVEVPDSFTPTEDISEDRSVSFPVDI